MGNLLSYLCEYYSNDTALVSRDYKDQLPHVSFSVTNSIRLEYYKILVTVVILNIFDISVLTFI